MKIENYSFGQMIVSGQKYTSDLLICSEEVKSNWWRESGHSLCREDLMWVLKRKPDLLIIGTGKSGVMTVPQELQQELEQELDVVVEKNRAGS